MDGHLWMAEVIWRLVRAGVLIIEGIGKTEGVSQEGRIVICMPVRKCIHTLILYHQLSSLQSLLPKSQKNNQRGFSRTLNLVILDLTVDLKMTRVTKF
jgi:hypothetical protein